MRFAELAKSYGPRVVVTAVLLIPIIASSQIIQIKTVPIATGRQFTMFPSENRALGNIAIAMDDPLLDPFVNPAKTSNLQGHLWVSSPVFYRISNDLGSAKTLPVALFVGNGKTFGGAAVALQQLSPAAMRGTGLLREQSLSNLYFYGLFGTKLRHRNTAVAASVYLADLNGLAGVEMLYPNSDEINQYGHFTDLRLAMVTQSQQDNVLEAMFIYQNFDLTHDVTTRFWNWSPDFSRVINTHATERNRDHTRMWGIHLGYTKPMIQEGVRLGGIFTFNRKVHPKIPNYELMNIPRDPGDSWAFNFGVGASRRSQAGAVGLDLIYEPILSKTWADAGTFITASDGSIIPPWGHTVDNRFRFSNALLRFGFMHHENRRVSLSGGIEARLISYRLTQQNHVEAFSRRLKERWIEWTLTWGIAVDLAEGEVMYLGSVTSGTGRPGVRRTNWPDNTLAAENILIAPEGPLTLQDEQVFTHQIVVSMPFGQQARRR